MVTTGAEMPILNGMASAAWAGAAAACSATPSATAAMLNFVKRIGSSKCLARSRAAISALRTVIGPVNVAPVALGPDILLDEAPDGVFDGVEARLAFYGQPARALERDRDALLHHSRPAGEHDDAVS